MKVHPSALKHGVSPQDAIQAAEWPVWIEPLAEDGPIRRELRLGFDTGARFPETVVLMLEDSEEMVIHARPARKKYLNLLPQRSRPALGMPPRDLTSPDGSAPWSRVTMSDHISGWLVAASSAWPLSRSRRRLGLSSLDHITSYSLHDHWRGA